MSFAIAIGLFVLAVVAYVSLRNSLVAANQRVNSGWSSVEVQLKRRHDLVPNLVKAAGAAQRHERGIFDAILSAREKAISALAGKNVGEISSAEAALTGGLRNFLSYAEDNPEITATTNIATLQRQIEDTEDQIAAARRYYNATVENYNITVESVPWNFLAPGMGMKTRSMIEFTPADRANINVVPEVNL